MNLRTVLVITLIMIAMTEVILRLVISMPSTQQFDSQLGYTNIPGSKMIESQEGYSRVVFNQLGFNDSDPDNSLKRKVFVIGDSYTEAFQVPIDKGYVGLLERKFADKKIDFIKLARDSFWPVHYPIVSERYYSHYKPELTIIETGSHTMSDLYGGNLSINYDDEGEITNYTVSTSEDDIKKEYFRGILNNSALAYYLLRKYKYLIKKILKKVSSVKNIFVPDSTEVASKKKKISVDDAVKRLAFVFNQIQGNLVIVYLPSPGLNVNRKKSGSNKVRDVVKASAKEVRAAFIDLTDVFIKDFSDNNHRFLNGFSNSKPWTGHLNAEGHKVVAEALFDKLIQSGHLK